jgi:hypothetical protein
MSAITVYHAASVRLCLAPGRAFASLREAAAFAIEAAAPWGVAQVVWQSRAGLLRRLTTYPPQRPQRTPP